MFLRALPIVFVLCGLALYAVLGGADFGAGVWQLVAGRGPRAVQFREHIHRSIGPVWEANHVWLIFVITVFWTAYSKAFGSIASTLAIPMFVALIGIIFRGVSYALRAGAAGNRESTLIDTVFAVSSLLTPFTLGAAAAAVAVGRVPVGNAAGHLFDSWFNLTSILIGLLAVTNGAFLAAVSLAGDAARRGDEMLQRAFRERALAAGLIGGAVAVAALVVLHGEHRAFFDKLFTGDALAAVIVSALGGTATVALVNARRYEPARYTAALTVTAVIAGWVFARWPIILPHLTVYQAAAPHETLVAVVIAVLAGASILFPSLALLFRLALGGRLVDDGELPSAGVPGQIGAPAGGLLARFAGAAFIVGVGLLVFIDGTWAHVLGLVGLGTFAITGFLAIVDTALDAERGVGSTPQGH